jgi:hypothetical protein
MIAYREAPTRSDRCLGQLLRLQITRHEAGARPCSLGAGRGGAGARLPGPATSGGLSALGDRCAGPESHLGKPAADLDGWRHALEGSVRPSDPDPDSRTGLTQRTQTGRRQGDPAILGSVLGDVIGVVSPDERVAWRAADIRRRHHRRCASPIALADCFALATVGTEETLATADPDLARIESIDVVALLDTNGRRPRASPEWVLPGCSTNRV